MKKLLTNLTAAVTLGGIGGDANVARNDVPPPPPAAHTRPLKPEQKPATPQDKAPPAHKEPAQKDGPFRKLAVQERSELIIDSILPVLQHTGLAALVQDVPGIGFSTGKPGEYKAGGNALSDDSIRQVRINTGDGNIRYFKRVAAVDYPNQKHVPKKGESDLDAAERYAQNCGFRASAWQETDQNGAILKKDGKSDIRFCFPGFTTDDTTALNIILLDGKLNPQAYAVPTFVNETLDKVYGKDRKGIGTAHVVGNSMGASNGLVAQKCLLVGEVPCDRLNLFEPFAASLAYERINRQLQDPSSVLFKSISRFPGGDLLNTGAETIANPNMADSEAHSYRAAVRSKNGKLGFSNTAILPPHGSVDNNRMVGAETLLDITGYKNITPGLPGLLDPRHMNGNIAAVLIAQNEIETGKKKGMER